MDIFNLNIFVECMIYYYFIYLTDRRRTNYYYAESWTHARKVFSTPNMVIKAVQTSVGYVYKEMERRS
jgi:hypothetical protein